MARKSNFTNEQIAETVAALNAGGDIRGTAEKLGVSVSTLALWKRKAKAPKAPEVELPEPKVPEIKAAEPRVRKKAPASSNDEEITALKNSVAVLSRENEIMRSWIGTVMAENMLASAKAAL